MITQAPDRRAVAVHEAAHAVAAFSTGLIIAPMGLQIDAVREVNAAGICYFGEASGGRPRTRPFAAVLAAANLYRKPGRAEPASGDKLAAGIREARALPPGAVSRENVLAATLPDFPRLFGLLLADAPGATDPQLVAAYRAIEADLLPILRRPDVGRSIEAVADALVAGGRLVEADLHRLIEPSALTLAPAFARTIADLFADDRPVFLSFSGGKESVVLADLCEPWRDRVTLLWCNTGHFAPHMVEFVRGYRDCGWKLVEVHPHGMMHNWEAVGLPANIVPMENSLGWAEPRLQPWTQCCFQNRQLPANDFLAQQGDCVLIHGQRRDDRGPTAATIRGMMSQDVEVAMPLWEWSEQDVMARIVDRRLSLPSHYAELVDSLECLVCPAMISAERLAYLDTYYPKAAAFVRPLARRILDVAREAVASSDAALADALRPRSDRDAA